MKRNTSAMKAMIEVEQLCKDFDDFRAVDNINLQVEEGKVLALLGPNGAGKTTTVRMMTSILAPTSGTTRIAGYDVVKQPEKVRASVGVLTEQHGLYERMKGVEYLDFFGKIYHLPADLRRERAVRLMKQFGLGSAMDKRLGEYSKGMKQKLALVRAMLHDPAVLLLDEPTSAMDPFSAKQVRDAIIDLKQGKRTFLITTHNLTEAQLLADHIAIISKGKIIAYGTFEELVTQFIGDPLMEVRFAQPLNGVVKELDMIDIIATGDDWIRYRATNPFDVNPPLVRKLAGLGVDVVTISPVTQTLEQIYLNVVKEDEAEDTEASS